MGKSLNEIKVIGHVGQDPESKNLESGSNLVRFSLATTEKYKNKNQQLVEKTEWHNIVAWNKLADIIQKYVIKGSKVFINGKMTYRSYENDSGQKINVSEIIASDVILLTSKQNKENPTPLSPPDDEDDLPY